MECINTFAKKIIEVVLSKDLEIYTDAQKRNRVKKEWIYTEFYKYFPSEITIVPNDFAADRSIPWSGAESAKCAMESRQQLYEEEIAAFLDSTPANRPFSWIGINERTLESAKIELSNICSFNKAMAAYIVEYQKITSALQIFKSSSLFNEFQTYASIEVQNRLLQFEVAYSNAYHTVWGVSRITRINMEMLRLAVIDGIRKDLNVA